MECDAVNASLLLNLINNNFLIFLTGNLPILNPYVPQKSKNLQPHSSNSIENATPFTFSLHSWKCDPTRWHIPFSLLYGSTPPASWGFGLFENFLCVTAQQVLQKVDESCLVPRHLFLSGRREGKERKVPAVCTLHMVTCSSSPVTPLPCEKRSAWGGGWDESLHSG